MIWNEIVCLGDSITYGARDEYGRSPTVELSRIMTDQTGEVYICHNYGISGETSADLLRRSWRACSSHRGAKIALLMIGTNDTQKAIPPEIYEDNIRQIVTICKVNGMHVIVATLPALAFTPLYYKNSSLIDEYNKIIVDLSAKMNYDVCDMSGVEKHYIDGVHFTNEGHKEIARRWAMTMLRSQT